jgi:hypothetical protein
MRPSGSFEVDARPKTPFKRPPSVRFSRVVGKFADFLQCEKLTEKRDIRPECIARYAICRAADYDQVFYVWKALSRLRPTPWIVCPLQEDVHTEIVANTTVNNDHAFRFPAPSWPGAFQSA